MKYILLILALVLLAIPVSAGNTEINNFYENSTGNQLQNVHMLVFECVDAQCENVVKPAIISQNSGNLHTLAVTYPGTSDWTRYASYFFAEGYLPKAFTFQDRGSGRVFEYDTLFNKAPICGAEIDGFSVVNELYPNEPLQINLTVDVDATTYSAFSYTGIGPAYVPRNSDLPGVERFYSANTTVYFEIINSSGAIVYTDSVNILIHIDDVSADVSFDFNWTENIGPPGNYTARVFTEVTDDKCVLSKEFESVKSFTVLEDRPSGEYFLLINYLSIDNITDIFEYQNTVPFSYEKVSNKVDNNGIHTELTFNASYTIYEKYTNTLLRNQVEIISAINDINPRNIMSTLNISNLGIGTYYLEVTGVFNSADVDGYNQATIDVQTVDFEIKGIPGNAPTINITSPNEGDVFILNNSFVLVDFEYITTDALACWYSLNGDVPVLLPGCINGTLPAINQPGIYNLTITAHNNQGSVSDSITFIVVEELQANITSPTDGTVFNATNNITFIYEVTGGLNKNCLAELVNTNNGSTIYNNTDCSANFVLENLPVGNYSFTVNATDDANQNVSETVLFEVTYDPVVPPTPEVDPFVNITSPNEGDTVTSPFNLTYIIQNADSCEYSINGGILTSCSLTHEEITLPIGTYTITVFATNISTNKTANDTVSFIVDSVIPPTTDDLNVTITLPGNNTVFNTTETIPINYTITGGVGPYSCVIDINGQLIIPSTPCGNTTVGPLQNGTYIITVTVTDSDGNTTSSSVTITIGTIPPPPPKTITDPLRKEIVERGIYIANFDIHDNNHLHPGVQELDLRFVNNKDMTLTNVIVTISIPELGAWVRAGPFRELRPGESVRRVLLLDIYDAPTGFYDLRLSFTSNEYIRANWYEVYVE